MSLPVRFLPPLTISTVPPLPASPAQTTTLRADNPDVSEVKDVSRESLKAFLAPFSLTHTISQLPRHSWAPTRQVCRPICSWECPDAPITALAIHRPA